MTNQELEARINAQATKLSLLEQQVVKQKNISLRLMWIILFMLLIAALAIPFAFEGAMSQTNMMIVGMSTIIIGSLGLTALIESLW